MKSSVSNKTSVYGEMGGLAKARTGASSNRTTNKLVIPRGAAAGLAYMKTHRLLSRNPQSGGIGRMKSKPCCAGLGKTALLGRHDLRLALEPSGGDYGCINGKCVLDGAPGLMSKTYCESTCPTEQLYRCVDNACVADEGGADRDTCNKNCGGG